MDDKTNDNLNGFVDEYNKLTQKYGHQLQATIEPEQMGAVWQVRPRLTVVAVEGWQPEGNNGNGDKRHTEGNNKVD